MIFLMRLWCPLIFLSVTSFVWAGMHHTAKLDLVYKNSGKMYHVSIDSGARDLSIFEARGYAKGLGNSIRWIVRNGKLFEVDAPGRPKLSLDARTRVTSSGKIFCPDYLFGYGKKGRITLLDEKFQQTTYEFRLPENYRNQGSCMHPVLGKNDHVYFVYQDDEYRNILVKWQLERNGPKFIEACHLPLPDEKKENYVFGVDATDDGALLTVSLDKRPNAYYQYSEATQSFDEIVSPRSCCDCVLLSEDAHALVHTEDGKERWYDLKTKTWVDVKHDIFSFSSDGLCLTKIHNDYFLGNRNGADFIALAEVFKLYGLEKFLRDYHLSTNDEYTRISAIAADGSSLVFLARNKATGLFDLLQLTFFVRAGNENPRREPFPLNFVLKAHKYFQKYTGMVVEEIGEFEDDNAIVSASPNLNSMLSRRWRIAHKLETIIAASDNGKSLLISAKTVCGNKVRLKITLNTPFWELK